MAFQKQNNLPRQYVTKLVSIANLVEFWPLYKKKESNIKKK